MISLLSFLWYWQYVIPSACTLTECIISYCYSTIIKQTCCFPCMPTTVKKMLLFFPSFFILLNLMCDFSPKLTFTHWEDIVSFHLNSFRYSNALLSQVVCWGGGQERCTMVAFSSAKWADKVWTQHSSFVAESVDTPCVLLTCPASAADWFITGSGTFYHVRDNACKRSLAICQKSRALCPYMACICWTGMIQSIPFSYFFDQLLPGYGYIHRKLEHWCFRTGTKELCNSMLYAFYLRVACLSAFYLTRKCCLLSFPHLQKTSSHPPSSLTASLLSC